MKKTISILLLLTLAFFTCKQAEKKDMNMDVHHEDILNNDWINDIKLNEGAKWQVNKATHEGVLEMQTLLKTERTVSIEAYHHLATQLNQVKNTIIKNCDMKGKAHNNLHVWLLPLIQKLDVLLNSKSVEDASKLKYSIEENINKYNTYFQY
ncbi:hypothetical protein [Thalassobellus suaedae]|uniref:Lipoprotein n=1 Tax=Thalassobellus suaedae TaxID=3074124 RepID=A0ABY9XX69_9FLAO|nr:hypothetical protein RHP51_06555 [Flavobacteriaceae bacterium HL-DH14]